MKKILMTKKYTREGSQFIYISVIFIDSVYIKNKNYYLQVFLEKYKYVSRETDVEIYSDEENSDDSDEENSNEKIQMKKIKYINWLFQKNKHEMINSSF